MYWQQRVQTLVHLMLWMLCSLPPAGTQQDLTACEDIHSVAVKNSNAAGTDLIIHISTLSTTNNHYTLHVPNHPLPLLECGENYYKCNILTFDFNKLVYIIVPSIGGFVWLEYKPQNKQPPVAYFQRVSRPCNPTKLYYGGGVDDFRVIMSCFNLTAQSDNRGSLYYIDFLYSVSNNVTTFSERLSSDREPVFGLSTAVSMAVRATGLFLHGCFSDEEMFVFDQGFPLHTTTEPTRLNPSFIEETQQLLENCLEYYHVDNTDRGSLVLYCTNQTAIEYEICTGEASYSTLNATNGIPYPCFTASNYTIYRQTDKLIFKDVGNDRSTEIEFNYPSIVYGKCIATATDVYYWGLTSNNTLLRVSVSLQSTEVILTDTCYQLNSTCLRPLFKAQGTVHSYFDPATFTIEVFNTSNDKELAEIHVPFQPDLYTVHTGPDSSTTTCDNQPTTGTTMNTTMFTEQNSFANSLSLSFVSCIFAAGLLLLC